MKKSEIAENIFNLLNDLEDYLKYGFKTKREKIDFSFFDLEEKEEQKSIKEEKKLEENSINFNQKEKDNKTKKELIELAFEILKCEKCILGKYCKNKVPGIGEIPANILIISGYLSTENEKDNLPITKQELELIYKWFEAIGISRNNLFITSILKCTHYHRKIEREYIEQCRYYLNRQIEILNPSFIITIGDVALSSLKMQKAENKLLHGTQFDYNNKNVFTMYHPKDMIKNPELKKEIWNDLKKFKTLITKD